MQIILVYLLGVLSINLLNKKQKARSFLVLYNVFLFSILLLLNFNIPAQNNDFFPELSFLLSSVLIAVFVLANYEMGLFYIQKFEKTGNISSTKKNIKFDFDSDRTDFGLIIGFIFSLINILLIFGVNILSKKHFFLSFVFDGVSSLVFIPITFLIFFVIGVIVHDFLKR